MKTAVVVVAIMLGSAVGAQELKPVPKDSQRVFIPGCTKGTAFTAGPRLEDQPGRSDIPEGMHLRMIGPKKMMAEIKGHEGSMIEITGLVLKGAFTQGGLSMGRIKVTPGPPMTGGGSRPGPADNQIVIDLEAWRAVPGDCPR